MLHYHLIFHPVLHTWALGVRFAPLPGTKCGGSGSTGILSAEKFYTPIYAMYKNKKKYSNRTCSTITHQKLGLGGSMGRYIVYVVLPFSVRQVKAK